MWPFKRRATELLAQSSLPNPESAMASMLALRIAQIPADPKYTDPKLLNISITGDRVIEVRYAYVTREKPFGGYEGVDQVTVGLPGPPHYRNVLLSGEDQQLVGAQFRALQQRSKDLADHNADCNSQDAALIILEGLL